MDESIEFNPKVVLEILVKKSAQDPVLAALIESAIWQSKYMETQVDEPVDDSLTEN